MEIDFKTLYALQDKVLESLKGKELGLYLTGGTALHRFYYNDLRYSEDLDFFSVDNNFNANLFKNILTQNGLHYKITREADDFQQFIVENMLKIDLVNDRVPHLDDFVMQNGIRLDNKDNILANKFSAILSRSEPRDVYDIFVLLKNNNIDKAKIIQNIKEKTADDIDLIFAVMKTFTMENKHLNNIYFCNDTSRKAFENEYFGVVNEFVERPLQNLTTDDLLQVVESAQKMQKARVNHKHEDSTQDSRESHKITRKRH